jgi:hypothetical protein
LNICLALADLVFVPDLLVGLGVGSGGDSGSNGEGASVGDWVGPAVILLHSLYPLLLDKMSK